MMRAIIIPSCRQVAFTEVPSPSLSEDTALVGARSCSIFMENVDEFAGKDPRTHQLPAGARPNPMYAGFPFPMKGEVLGEVLEVGKRVQDLKVGDRVVGYAEYKEEYAINPNHWVRVSKNISDEAAVAIPFTATALHCIRRAEVKIGDSVVIIGQGPMGLMVTQWAAIAGAGQVIAVDLLNQRLALAHQHGATHTINPHQGDPEQIIHDLTDGKGPDVVIDAGNASVTFNLALAYARTRGRVVILSFHTQPVTIDDITRDFIHKELEIRATRAAGPPNEWGSPLVRWTGMENFRLAEKFVAQNRIHPEVIITHHLPVESIREALRLCEDERLTTMKVVLTW